VDGGQAVLEVFALPAPPAPPPTTCHFEVVLSTDGAHRVELIDCDEVLGPLLLEVAEDWRFRDVVAPPEEPELRLHMALFADIFWETRRTLHLVDRSDRLRPPVEVEVPAEAPAPVEVPAPPAEHHFVARADEAVPVHWSDVTAKKRVSPTMPNAAKQLNMTEERCEIRVFIDEKGVPYDLILGRCPAIYHESTLEALWQWRFYPRREDGVRVKSQFHLVVVYRLTGSAPSDHRTWWQRLLRIEPDREVEG
jgi:hypothetical protein